MASPITVRYLTNSGLILLTCLFYYYILIAEVLEGFRNLKTNNFEEVMLIRDEADMEEFRNMYGIEGEIEHFY